MARANNSHSLTRQHCRRRSDFTESSISHDAHPEEVIRLPTGGSIDLLLVALESWHAGGDAWQGRQFYPHRILAYCQLGAEQTLRRTNQRCRLHLSRL